MTIKCEFCNGLGKDEDTNDCAWCWGTGSKAAQKRMAPPAEQHHGEPVAWLVKCKQSGLVEQAEPNEKASNPEHWTDAFPVYTHADPGEVEQHISRRMEMAEQKSELHRQINDLRAQLAERDALLERVYLDSGFRNLSDPLQEGIEGALSASAEPSAPVEIDERAEFEKAGAKIGIHAQWLTGREWLLWQARAALERKP